MQAVGAIEPIYNTDFEWPSFGLEVVDSTIHVHNKKKVCRGGSQSAGICSSSSPFLPHPDVIPFTTVCVWMCKAFATVDPISLLLLLLPALNCEGLETRAGSTRQ